MLVCGTPSVVGLGLPLLWFGPMSSLKSLVIPLILSLVEDGASLALTNFQALMYIHVPMCSGKSKAPKYPGA